MPEAKTKKTAAQEYFEDANDDPQRLPVDNWIEEMHADFDEFCRAQANKRVAASYGRCCDCGHRHTAGKTDPIPVGSVCWFCTNLTGRY